MFNIDHYSVLVKEVINKMEIIPDGTYVDCTFGHGGHSGEIFKNLNENGKLIAFDVDSNSKSYFDRNFKNKKNCYFINKNFSRIKTELNLLGIEKVNGIFYDLGVSNSQLTGVEKGLTYKTKAKLDMRLDNNISLTAAEILNTYSVNELSNIFKKYGDEKKSLVLSQEIVKYRDNNKFEFNYQLNEVIDKVKINNGKKHKLKNIYQSLRIEVNDEINLLRDSLLHSVDLLEKNAKILIITFNSLEDKIVKNIFWELKQETVPNHKFIERKYSTSKTIYPTKEEILENRASRSGKLRILKKL